MTEQELKTALEHDIAQRHGDAEALQPLVLAAECLRNAALASRGAEAALLACKPPALTEAKQAAQLAVMSLEQALVLMGMETKANE